MKSAIRIGKYLAEHMKSAFRLMGADPTQVKAQAILTWLHRKPVAAFTKQQAFSDMRATFRRATEIDGPLADLCERNYLRVMNSTGTEHTPGRKPSPVYEVNPSLLPAHITHNTYITLTATISQRGQAHEVAAARQNGKQSRNPLGDIGSNEKNYEADYYGALAEIVISDWLRSYGLDSGVLLITRYYLTKPDMSIEGSKVEIKCSPPGTRFVHISERQHSNQDRRPDNYLVAIFETENKLTLSKPVPYDKVNEWQRWTGGHEPCYRIDRKELPLLTERKVLAKLT